MIFPGLNDSEAQSLVDTATAVGMDPQWLWEVINFESGHDAGAYNEASGARGLIQFMPATAAAMGFTADPAAQITAADDLVNTYNTYESQMAGPVKDYFTTQVPGPFPTRQSVYMGVFMPVARNVPPDTTMATLYNQNPKSLGGAAGYAIFTQQNPGILTVADYVNKTLAKAAGSWTVAQKKEAAIGGGAAVVLALLAWYVMRRQG